MADRVLLNISDNEGYAPNQIDDSVTLGDFLELVKEAIEEFGEDAMIVLSNGQRYGAGFGKLSTYGDLFESTTRDEDEDI